MSLTFKRQVEKEKKAMRSSRNSPRTEKIASFSKSSEEVVLNAVESPKKQKRKRGYADPSVYEHLHFLPDYIEDGLDVLFCGINPGYMSAQKGHHFSNPTNHFWRCLFHSGLTSRRLSPEEDYELPALFNLGLTNLVDRPSAEQAELSKLEMTMSIPALLDKIVRFRPRYVCFVGMGIWGTVQNFLLRSMTGTGMGTTAQRSRKRMSTIGLQPYKWIHEASKKDSQASETFFYVVPSTSGRVVQYQLAEKIKFFKNLKDLVDREQSASDTSGMLVVSSPRA